MNFEYGRTEGRRGKKHKSTYGQRNPISTLNLTLGHSKSNPPIMFRTLRERSKLGKPSMPKNGGIATCKLVGDLGAKRLRLTVGFELAEDRY